MQLGGPLTLVLDAHSKRALEVLGPIGNSLSNLAFNNSVLRRVPHLELPSRDLRGGDNFKIGEWYKISNL